MNVLFLRRNGENTIAAPRHYHDFEQEIGKYVNAEWAGKGWPKYRDESFADTVRRVMPDVDWVIDRERDDRLPNRRAFMVGAYLSDLHGRGAFGIHGLRDYIDSVNNVGYDALFMRYLKIHGTEADPEIFLDELEPAIYFLPWSVNIEEFKPLRKKTHDVTFIGSVGKHYPLRKRIWSLLPIVCAEHGAELLMQTRPRGANSFSDGSKFPDAYFKSRYSEALARTRIFIFGCSKFKYPLLKYFEGMASGCCVLADEPSCACELGFEDGVNYVKIDEENWYQKLSYCLDHPEKVKEIGRNARKLISTMHSHQARAVDFLSILDNFI